ncbi:MAG TPA: hypothetical protein VFE42_24785 [Chloroflexota bacterium]|nr:hypothetical protein [Chloroflexota bacterium]
MTRLSVKTMAGAGAAAGLTLALVATAHVASAAAPKPVRAVAVYNQSKLVADGLTPKAAVQQAQKIVHYTVTMPHHIPAHFQLMIVRVFPYLPGVELAQDTQTYMNLTGLRKTAPGQKPVAPPSFEVDHQHGAPYSYPREAYYTLSVVNLGKRKASVAEQKYTDYKKKQSVDLLYVYWYDKKTHVATEVTAELHTSRLSRSEVLKIAASFD